MPFGIILALMLDTLAAGYAGRALAQSQPPGSLRSVSNLLSGLRIGDAARKFLATLDDAQRTNVLFDFRDNAQPRRWSNLPTSVVKREGLHMGDLTQPQRDAVLGLLAAALSPQGYEKVLQIMEGDEVLKGNNSGRRGAAPCLAATSTIYPCSGDLRLPSRG